MYFRSLPFLASIATVTLLLAGCGSGSRTAVSGYTDDMLNGKRVMLLLPQPDASRLENPAAWGASRGLVEASARESFLEELRLRMGTALDETLDSNTVLVYQTQPIGLTTPLNASTDFSGSEPVSWEKLKTVGREGNIDFLVVLQSVTVVNSPKSQSRGTEGMQARYMLLDLQAGKSMAWGEVSSSEVELVAPAMSYSRFARALAAKLPFVVTEQKN